MKARLILTQTDRRRIRALIARVDAKVQAGGVEPERALPCRPAKVWVPSGPPEMLRKAPGVVGTWDDGAGKTGRRRRWARM